MRSALTRHSSCAPESAAVHQSAQLKKFRSAISSQSSSSLRYSLRASVWSLSGGWAFQSGDLSGPAGTHLYATDPSGTVVDLNLLTGQVEYSLNQAVTVLAVDTSRVYATCGSSGQFLCAYNISTGAVEWQDTQLLASPALAAEADGVLYLGTGVAVNAASGQVIKTLWSARNGNPPATAIAVGDGRIAVVTDPRVLDLYGLKGY